MSKGGKINPLPSSERLNELFSYDPVNGVLTRKVSLQYNALAGTEAGTVGKNGYRQVSIRMERHYVHRIAWKMATGEDPEEIDHIDGNSLNNAISNLRAVNGAENRKNQKKPKDNKSGVLGVIWNSKLSKWQAQIQINRRYKHLGVFDHLEDAVAARKAAEIKYGFHKNHGRDAVQQEQGASA